MARIGVPSRLPPRSADPAGPEPVVHDIDLDGDRSSSDWTDPPTGLRLRGPGTDLEGEARGHGTVVFPTRRDLYGRQVRLATAVYHLHHPGGLAVRSAWRDRLPGRSSATATG